MKEKYICEKFNPELCNSEMRIDEVILSQFEEVLPENYRELKLEVSSLYMPEEEQQKMKYWMLKNLKLFSKLPKKIAEREMNMLELCYFPSSILNTNKG